MRYPLFLRKGGSIGCIAPSFGCTISPYRENLLRACQQFSAEGYKVICGENCFADVGIGKSNTAKSCADEINRFFTDSRADILISCGGGETMCEDLSYVDFSSIGSVSPKWFMGYSDNTNLTFLLPTLCDTAAIYGPNITAFGTDNRHVSIDDAWDLLMGIKMTVDSYDGWEKDHLKSPEDPYAGYNITEPYKQISFPSDEIFISGRLIGGCLDVLSVLCGTRFDKVREFAEKYADDGIIWFLEACDLNPMGMRRALWQLKEAGWFSHVKGFLFGRPMHFYEQMMGADRINSVTDILTDYDVPILMDLDIGHLPPMMPLISGAFAEIRSDGTSLNVKHILR